MTFGDPASMPHTFLRFLRQAHLRDEHPRVLELVERWSRASVREPRQFAERAWPAYRPALCDGRYWLSVDEVLGMCAAACKSIVIFVQQPGCRLTLAGHHVLGQDVPLCIKLDGDNKGLSLIHI